jgi:hypothetical protein
MNFWKNRISVPDIKNDFIPTVSNMLHRNVPVYCPNHSGVPVAKGQNVCPECKRTGYKADGTGPKTRAQETQENSK